MPAAHSFSLIVEPECAGERLDRFLATKLPHFTRAYLQTRIEHADVQVDGRPRKASFRLRGGEQIAVTIPDEPSRTTLIPEQMSLAILYEDADVIVVDKPAGLVVHPGAGNWTGTLVHGILAHAP
ncbi:MAG: S4 domain-containing protein, partial [Thermomicrobiales bacterium]